jgi:RecG-like helicase
VALRKFVNKLTKPIEEVDRERLAEWCTAAGGTALKDVEVRKPVRVSGEVRSIRIVPRAGADALEATISDGEGVLTAVFLGRRKILGISPGRRVCLEGVVSKDAGAHVMYNPVYEFVK